LFNILSESNILEGIKKVWASPYTERSFKWRQQYLSNPENVYPSILIIPSVDVDYSGVMITKGINSGDESDLTVAFSRGAGGAVDGQSAETRLITDRSQRLLAPAREPSYLRLPQDGGTSKNITTFENPILNEKNIKDLRNMAQQIKTKLPAETSTTYQGAWDVELGFENDRLWLFQIRPFVENKNAKSSEYLASISPTVDTSKEVSLKTKI
ncbi:MAG: phosphoenolpyruvate synthase, partial [Flavobacteriaceae bacterium]|nr:phosphoenolpyruvate synthase [Flavobacteriaceae bacterium]